MGRATTPFLDQPQDDSQGAPPAKKPRTGGETTPSGAEADGLSSQGEI